MLAVLSHTLFFSHVVFAHVVLKLSACATSFHCAYRRKFRAMSDFSVKRGPDSMSLVADMVLEGGASAEGEHRGGKRARIYLWSMTGSNNRCIGYPSIYYSHCLEVHIDTEVEMQDGHPDSPNSWPTYHLQQKTCDYKQLRFS